MRTLVSPAMVRPGEEGGLGLGSSLNNKQLGWEREGEEFFMLCQQREERPQKIGQRSGVESVIADVFVGL